MAKKTLRRRITKEAVERHDKDREFDLHQKIETVIDHHDDFAAEVRKQFAQMQKRLDAYEARHRQMGED